MYKAEQERLAQATNQGLINIRRAEIDYHVTMNATMGGQAALIGGFTYGTFLRNNETYRFWSYRTQTCYYVIASLTVSSAIIVIVLTMLIHVMAPGLALNGPVGSMARATQGMKAEQNTIAFFFTLMMCSFTVATVLGAWTIMDEYAAFASSLVFLFSTAVAYYYVQRIYARFVYVDDTNNWEENSEPDPLGDRDSSSVNFGDVELRNSAHHLRDTMSNPMHNQDDKIRESTANLTQRQSMFGRQSMTHRPSVAFARPRDSILQAPPRESLMHGRPSLAANRESTVHFDHSRQSMGANHAVQVTGTVSGAPAANGVNGENHSNAPHPQHVQNNRKSSVFNWIKPLMGSGGKSDRAAEMQDDHYDEHKIRGKDVAMEGYLTKRIKSKKEFLKDPWERRYFVLNYRGEFFYYRNRQEYRKAPVTGREEAKPIELDEYLVKYYNSVTPNAMQKILGDENGAMNGGVTSSSSDEEGAAENEETAAGMMSDAQSAVLSDSHTAAATNITMNTEVTFTSVKTNSTSVRVARHQQSGVGIFQFKLVPLNGREVRLHYGLRCDTEEEFMMWLEVMQEVSTCNFEESYYSDK